MAKTPACCDTRTGCLTQRVQPCRPTTPPTFKWKVTCRKYRPYQMPDGGNEMPDEVVRMHLVQALTRTEQSTVRTHLRAALDHWDASAHTHDKSLSSVGLTHIERAETTLETWLVHHAKAGVPEIALIEILRDYADRIDTLGHVPRSWAATKPRRTTSSTNSQPKRQSAQTDQQGGYRR
jgi:hypothetical protein